MVDIAQTWPQLVHQRRGTDLTASQDFGDTRPSASTARSSFTGTT